MFHWTWSPGSLGIYYHRAFPEQPHGSLYLDADNFFAKDEYQKAFDDTKYDLKVEDVSVAVGDIIPHVETKQIYIFYAGGDRIARTEQATRTAIGDFIIATNYMQYKGCRQER